VNAKPRRWDGKRYVSLCDDDGGRGIGAGHVCRCVRKDGHPIDSDRPHGCTCGALWAAQR
jgi:hypothetical protein